MFSFITWNIWQPIINFKRHCSYSLSKAAVCHIDNEWLLWKPCIFYIFPLVFFTDLNDFPTYTSPVFKTFAFTQAILCKEHVLEVCFKF